MRAPVRPWLCAGLCLLLCALPAAPVLAQPEQGGSAVLLDDGHQVHDLVDLFLAYGQAAAGADAATREMLWDEMLESRHPDFFAQVIYRGFEGEQLDLYKQAVIAQFWDQVMPEFANLRRLNDTAADKILQSRAALTQMFPDFAPDCDYYITVSFSFNGKTVELNNQTVLAIGLENFVADDPGLAITMAHEQFHLYHFQSFSPYGGLYRAIWAEGLAVYASEELVPGYRLSQYLGFTAERMNEIYGRFDELKLLALANLSNSDHAMKRAFVGMEDNELDVPPGTGYYLGEHVVFTLVREGHTLDELARWDADDVYAAMERILPSLDPDL